VENYGNDEDFSIFARHFIFGPTFLQKSSLRPVLPFFTFAHGSGGRIFPQDLQYFPPDRRCMCVLCTSRECTRIAKL